MSIVRQFVAKIGKASIAHDGRIAELSAALTKAQAEYAEAPEVKDADERLKVQTEMAQRLASAGKALQSKQRQWREYLLRQQAKVEVLLGNVKGGD